LSKTPDYQIQTKRNCDK